ncbi:hypothetical protein HYPSUDRAFT_41465 [Hypholoma sublateritium FD-334 SS-4]|uniref:CSC1/OSCA1-like N-terminal transmembrane domain-containing protein n=1 Tax=Hypholoma sublateritium (strain FD-334 SS-4) TaxID=945553 RepID=A0A0D2PPM2_HYPSF|nr:hypothetical protein HYPSUDRAFT_41465 [Hypholoma sublateritium FD-334 SS-4]
MDATSLLFFIAPLLVLLLLKATVERLGSRRKTGPYPLWPRNRLIFNLVFHPEIGRTSRCFRMIFNYCRLMISRI